MAQSLVLGAALAILGGYIAWNLYVDRSDIEARERERLQTQARVIDENLERQLAAVNSALTSVRAELPHKKTNKDDSGLLSRRLQAMSDTMPGVRSLNVLDGQGTIVASNRDQLIGKNFREREYFQTARQGGDPQLLYVSPPFTTALGYFAITVTRVIVDARGAFAGIVVATLDPAYFRTLLGSVSYAPDMWSGLAHGDGKLFLTVPQRDNIGGTDLHRPGSLFTRHQESGLAATVLVGTVMSVGEQGMMAQRTVRPASVPMDKPLVIAVARELSALFAPWRRQVRIQGGLFGALVLVSVAGMYLYQRRQAYFARIAAEHEAERRRSADLYSTIVRASLDGFWITDTTARILDANDSICRMLGYSREELLRMSIFDIEADETPEETNAHMAEMKRSGSVRFEARHRRKDGSIINVEVSVLHVKELGPRFFAFVRDVTGLKQAEAELRIAATAFEAQEGMLVTDADNIILGVNRAFCDITGYEAEEIVGKTPNLLKSGRHEEAFYAGMWQSLRDQGVWQGEIWNRRKNGDVFPEWLTVTAVKNDLGDITNYVATLTDITQRKAAEDEIKHLAFYDPLTRLPNRRLLLDRLQQALASSARSGREGALLFIDLDNFKTLNDTLGHDTGDLLLQQVAQRLTTCVREGDTVARLGGDEFVVMLEDLSANDKEAATQSEAVGEKILAVLNQIYRLGGHEHHSTPSIGVTLFNDHVNAVDELLKRADLAMYQAKAAGRNTLRFFDPDMQALVTQRAAMETDLRHGLQDDQFVIYYQAQVRDDGTLIGAEALVRWQHPQRGLVSPLEFIPLAEESGLILGLGHWILETACAQLASWAADPVLAKLTLAVNVSARQFRQVDFVAQVLAVLEHTGAQPQRLKLELTESLLLDDVEDIIAKMTALKAKGVGFSLDDFGTGYSSLSYLKRLPLDQLKIDQSFVRDVFTDINDAAIAQTIIALSQTMGLAVIAEGVETEEQRDFLSRLGCLSYQGYLFSRPLPPEEFERFVRLR